MRLPAFGCSLVAILGLDYKVITPLWATPPRCRCEALIESLRSQGQYNGRLYFITEELKCFQVGATQLVSHDGDL